MIHTKNNNLSKRKRNALMKKSMRQTDSAQMIVLMGIVLALSVFMLSSIAAEIANLDVIVTTSEAITLPSEFSNLKEAFVRALNYNLANVIIVTDKDNLFGGLKPGIDENETILIGDINNLSKAFNQTRDEFHQIELRYGRIFDARLNRYWYAKGNGIYFVDVTLMLDNGDAKVTESMVYSIVCLSSV